MADQRKKIKITASDSSNFIKAEKILDALNPFLADLFEECETYWLCDNTLVLNTSDYYSKKTYYVPAKADAFTISENKENMKVLAVYRSEGIDFSIRLNYKKNINLRIESIDVGNLQEINKAFRNLPE